MKKSLTIYYLENILILINIILFIIVNKDKKRRVLINNFNIIKNNIYILLEKLLKS